MIDTLDDLIGDVADAATRNQVNIVLAESCTAGLVANSLSCVPGASNWFCGSAVVYRNETKTAWLEIDADRLADHGIGPVSEWTAAAMCAGVLKMTPEADLAVSVTGHLGPDAPPELDGLIYVGLQLRHRDIDQAAADVVRHRLADHLPHDSPHHDLRRHRQWEAAALVLQRLIATLREK